MQILLLSDLHSRNAYFFARKKAKEGIDKIDRVICLGDYDDPEIVEYLRDIEIELGIKTTILPGNHDYALSRGFIVRAPYTLDPDFYRVLWQENPLVRDLILNAPTTHEEIHQGRKFFFSHAEFPEEAPASEETANKKDQESEANLPYKNELEFRMAFDTGRKKCFKKMQEKGVFALFRGHDHDYGLFSIPQDANPETAQVEHHYLSKVLDRNRIYIVNLGAFIQGEYGIFDTESLLMRFGVDG